MGTNKEIIESVVIPEKLRKSTTLARAKFYDRIDIFSNSVSGYENGKITQTWFYKDYNGIEVIDASLNSQFAQVVFLTGLNSRNKV